MPIKQKITPFLWFDSNAEDAANFYVSIFENSKITNIARYGDSGPGPKGSVMVVGFELEGQKFSAINGGPMFKLSEAISFLIDCHTQKEIDYYWQKLTSDGGKEQPCGWVKDKFGLSWQVNTSLLPKLLQSGDPARASRVMSAMLEMRKVDIARLQQAYDG